MGLVLQINVGIRNMYPASMGETARRPSVLGKVWPRFQLSVLRNSGYLGAAEDGAGARNKCWGEEFTMRVPAIMGEAAPRPKVVGTVWPRFQPSVLRSSGDLGRRRMGLVL